MVFGKGTGCPDERVKQFFVDGMAFVEKLGMPLNTKEKVFVWGFDGFDDAIGGHSGGDEARGKVFHGLMMRAVDLNGRLAGDAPEQ